MSIQDRISWNCPHCDQLYKTPIDMAGKSINCSQCEATVDVPVPDDVSMDDDSVTQSPVTEILRLRWSCSYCNLTFQTTPELGGQIIECPSCQAAISVPDKPM